MDLDLYLIILRILHIFAGVFWVGAAVVFFWFIEPSVKAAGPNGPPVMEQITVKRRFPQIITIAAATTVIAGSLLYWRLSGGFTLEWITTAPGLAFTIGGIAGIIVFFVGMIGIAPRVERMGAIGQAIKASGGPPNEEQMAEIHRIEGTLRTLGIIDLALLSLALLTMATARYLG